MLIVTINTKIKLLYFYGLKVCYIVTTCTYTWNWYDDLGNGMAMWLKSTLQHIKVFKKSTYVYRPIVIDHNLFYKYKERYGGNLLQY